MLLRSSPLPLLRRLHQAFTSSSSSSSPSFSVRCLCAGPVRSNHAFDEEALRSHLDANLPNADFSSMTIQQFTHGQSNPTFVVKSADGTKYVVRKQPPGKLLRGAHAVDREYTIMSALGGQFPVPTTQLFVEDPDVIGTPFFVYDFVEGRLLKDGRLPDVPVPDRRATYEAMAHTLAQFHSLDPYALGLGKFGADPSQFIPRQIRVWSKQYTAAATHEIKAMDELMHWLPRSVPEMDTAVSLVHGDFRVDNLIYDNDSPSVAAVLDWELSTLGHPLSDVAYNCMPYHMPNYPDSPVSGFGRDTDLAAEGLPSQEEYLGMYFDAPEAPTSIRRRASDGAPENWEFYLSFAFFRSASILQGVYARAKAGSASAPNALQVGALATEMAEIGLNLAQRHSFVLSSATTKTYTGWSDSFVDSTREAAREAPPAPATLSDYPVPQFPAPSDKAVDVLQRVRAFVQDRIIPAEMEILNHRYTASTRWSTHHPLFHELVKEAKAEGLRNMFMPRITDPDGKYGYGLTNLEYAPVAEATGRSLIAPNVFNCSAPDTGNMEVLALCGTEEQKETWLQPLLDGDIRSCFAMTEPGVASSDATNMAATVDTDGGDVVLNGRKWWISGALDPHCKVIIFMGRDTAAVEGGAPRHAQHSMVLVPMDTPGVTVHRPMTVFGYDDAPEGHAEMTFDNVRVPAANVLLGPGRGFEIAQKRLGPGRCHHVFRLLGASERALDYMVHRAHSRTAFGKPLVDQGTVTRDIALSRTEIDQARLLTFDAAHKMDVGGTKSARKEVAAIKVVAPAVASAVIDRAMQIHGAGGLSQDFPLAHFYAWARILRLADGPDEVHIAALGKAEARRG